MIVGKNSALKGFGLLLIIVIALLTIIGAFYTPLLLSISLVLSAALNIWVAYSLYKDWCE